MPKKIIAFLLIICAVLSFSGCNFILNGEYEYSSEHSENTTAIISDTGTSIVSNYDELTDSIMEMIESSTTIGKVRFHSYEGDPKEDTVQACMEVANDTPLGAYAVYYINSSLNKIVSDYQAQINITYKKTPKQINAIISSNSAHSIQEALKDALIIRTDSIAIETSLDGIDTDFINRLAKDIYYDTGSNIPILPEITASSYPEASIKKIVEITFNYPFTKDYMDRMNADFLTAVNDIRLASTDPDEAKQLLKIFENLSASVERCPSENALYIDNTAYGALVEGRASDIGMATAFKYLANRMGYECYTVAGRLKSVDHYWNIVKVGDHYYHCDPYNAEEKSVAACFLRTDAEISREYWWEAEEYKVCDGDLNYFIVSEIYENQ